MAEKYDISTELVHFDPPASGADPHRAAAPPLYISATFKQPSTTEPGAYDYTRTGNPTRSQLERHMGKLFGAGRCFAVNSGMAALDTICRLLLPGDEVVTGNDLYGGTNRLLSHLAQLGVVVHHVDTTDLSAARAKFSAKTRMLLLESPTNPLLQVADIASLSAAAKAVAPNCLVVVDNTVMSPLYQRPLALNADIHYESGTKYINGHHDVMSGFIGVDDPALADRLFFYINATGAGLAPFDAWLVLRGVKTMALRVARQTENAGIVARWLSERGYQVNYPGLSTHPGYVTHNRQASGAGAVLSFRTGSTQLSERIVDNLRLFGISVSFGACESLATVLRICHAAIPAEVRRERGLPEDLIRLCIGIEHPDDLLKDLQQAIDAAEHKFHAD